MKTCTKCKEEKLLEEFPQCKRNKDGKSSWCKKCNNKINQEHHKKFPWKQTYRSIIQRCNNSKNKYYKWYGGRGIKCEITVEELKFLWFKDKASNMNKPSIDREDNDGNYTLENCRFIELLDNITRVDYSKREKQVNQYDLQGNFIKTWKSGHKIERILGVSKGNISRCCSGKLKTAYGFIWKFKTIKED